MRIQRAPLFKFAACFAVLAFLLGVAAAGAAERAEGVSKDPQMIHKPFHFKSIGTGKYNGTPSFFMTKGMSECFSNCCWAYAGCASGAHTSCTSSGCDAWCDEGGSSHTSCEMEIE